MVVWSFARSVCNTGQVAEMATLDDMSEDVHRAVNQGLILVCLVGQSVFLLICVLIGWSFCLPSVGWVGGWSICHVAGWLAKWLLDCRPPRSICRSIDRLVNWSVGPSVI